jgi:hypothetical protein
MSNKKSSSKQIVILGLLGLVLAVVLGTQLFGGGSSSAPIEAVQTNIPASAQMAADVAPAANARVGSVFQKVDVDLDQLLQEIKVVDFDYAKEHGDRDPTLPLVGDSMLLRARNAKLAATQDTDDLLMAAGRKVVTGIMWDVNRPLAVVDNEVVTVGFEFEDTIVVKAIERDHVVLGLAGQDQDVVRELKEQ